MTAFPPPELTFGYFADAWLDEDGEHLWIAHSCKGEGVIHKLPNGIWQPSADGTKVEPSYSCDRCGLHQFVPITDPPKGWNGEERFASATKPEE